MKQIFLLAPALLLTVIFLPACSKSNLEYQTEYEKSYTAWLNFKKESDNSYRYIVVSGSWTGLSTTRTITVEKGKVVEQEYAASFAGGFPAGVPEDAKHWIETGDEVNTNAQRAVAYTLDEIYSLARTDWLVKRDNAKTYFETKNNGMISTAGYIVDGCADDCFVGITISLIEPL